MGNSWPIKRLDEIVEKVCVGFVGSCSKDYREHQKDSVPMIRTTNLTGQSIDYNNVKYISHDFHKKNIKSQLKKGDILVARHGENGLPSIYESDDEANCLNVVIIKPHINDDYIDNHYLLYALKSPSVVQEIQASIVGSVQGVVNTKTIANLDIPYPSRKEREFIVLQLGTLSKKIELNRQMNETLEAMAQALFKSWFVDFDPVIDNALAAGNAIPDAFAERAEQRKAVEKDKGINPLFPDAFEYTEEMGWIPQGWVVSDAGKEFRTVGGATPSTKNTDFWEGGDICWTTPKDLSGNQSKILLNTDRRITELGLKKISSGLLPINTVLMSSRAPVGYLALAKVPVAINQGYIALRCEKLLTPEFAIQWADSTMDEIKQRAGGTTFAEISKKSFREIPIIVPDQLIVDMYSSNAKGLYNQITSRVTNTESLSKLRDTLLPKLLSGELRIPDAEKLVEQAT
jgi:type I restriction enzyme S subunit